MSLFQNESSLEFVHLPMGLISMKMNLGGGVGGTFLYKWFGTKNRFDTEAKGTSELGIPSHEDYFAIQPALLRSSVPSKSSLYVVKRIEHLYKIQVHIMQQYLRNPALSLTGIVGCDHEF